MVTKLKRDPLAPLLCVLESVQDNEGYFWDTTLEFHIDLCLTCPSGACLVKCQYMDVGKAKAIEKMLKIWDVADMVLEAMA